MLINPIVVNIQPLLFSADNAKPMIGKQCKTGGIINRYIAKQLVKIEGRKGICNQLL
jgi:hypothetical protein